MTDQQLWFVLIFTVPFVPACIVFLFLKPQAGDARVGGSVPILKDLKLEAGGAIATYVIIVIFAIVAYSIITRNQAVAFELIPTYPDGSRADFKPSDLAKVRPPELVVKLDRYGSLIQRPVNDFIVARNGGTFVSSEPLYFSRGLMGQPIAVQVNANSAVLAAEVELRLAPKLPLEIKMRDLMQDDWLVRFDRTNYSVRASEGDITITRTLILTNTAKTVLDGRIEFPPWSVEGLYSLELRSYRLREEVGPAALGKIDTALSLKDDVAARIHAIGVVVSNLIGSASMVGQVHWTATSDHTQTGGIVGDDAAKVYVAAPIPRIEGVPGRIKPGESVLAWIQARVRMPERWKQDFPSIVSLYSHFTERAIIDVTATGGPELCGAVADVEVDAPDGSTALGPTAVWRTADSILTQALGLRKATKLVVPVRWNSPSCHPS